jgi:hypothetical protein
VGSIFPTKQCNGCALKQVPMSDLPNRGRTVRISPCLLLVFAISLCGISGCSGDDDEGLRGTFMSYCQHGGRIDVDSVTQQTDWFPGSLSTCQQALRCIEGRLSKSDRDYENTFYQLVGEFSDPMADVVVGCIGG